MTHSYFDPWRYHLFCIILVSMLFLESGDCSDVDFVWPICESEGTCVGAEMGQWIILAEASTTMSLFGPIYHLLRHSRRNHLDHCNFSRGDFISDGIHFVGGKQGQETGLVNIYPTETDGSCHTPCSAMVFPKATRSLSLSFMSASDLSAVPMSLMQW